MKLIREKLRSGGARRLGRLALMAAWAVASVGGAPSAWASNPTPYIQSISPLSVVPGSAQFTLTVSGTGFVSGAVVNESVLGSATTAPLATTFVSSTELTATVPASLIATAETLALTVANPVPGLPSNAAYLSVIASVGSLSFRASGGNVGPEPFSVVTGDFNGDGQLDLAETNLNDKSVWILLGNGDGTFKKYSRILVGISPEGLVAADLNGDGRLDLAVVENSSSNAEILAGNGDGTFTSAGALTTDPLPVAVVAGDFNGDGTLDLAVACQVNGNGTGGVDVFLGAGSGNFGSKVSYGSIGSATGLAVADFNGDRFLDLGVSDAANNEVWVLPGAGNGTFASTGNAYAAGPNPQAVVAGDFNKDGYQDLAVFDSASSSGVSILLNDGTGAFPASPTEYPTTSGGLFLAAADLNGDGNLDLAATSLDANSVSTLLGNGDGTFAANVDFPTGNQPEGIVAGDFDGDGRVDLAVLNNVDSTISLLLQQSPPLVLNPPALNFGNQPLGSRSNALTATITNTGSKTVTLETLLGNDPADFLQTNDCGTIPAPLAAGESCTLTVTFTPSTTGNLAGNIRIGSNAPGSPQYLPLSGVGTIPIASALSPNSLNFGTVAVGSSSAPQPIMLSNIGTDALTIQGITVTGDYTQTNACGDSVAAGVSCTINVTFKPTATGTRAGTLTVTDNSNAKFGSTQTASLTGYATAPVAGLSPASLTFASQAAGITSAAQNLTLSNAGSSALTISNITATGDFGQTNNCGTSVAAGMSCTISVTFKPTAAGARSGILTVTDDSNGSAGSTQTASLTGTGIVAVAGLAPASLSFASQAVGSTSPAQAVTLSNTGAAALSITSVTANGDFAVTSACGASVSPGVSCTINVTFTPTTNGTRAGVLTVADNSNGNSSTQTASLNGTGSGPEASLTPSSLTFASQTVGTASPAQTVTLTNTGAANLAVFSISAGGDFAETNLCGSSISPGRSCAISVTFKPTAASTRTAALTITDNSDNGNNSTQTVALSGSGAVPQVNLTPAALPVFSGQLVGTKSPAETITLSNTGAGTLSIGGIAVNGTNAADFAETSTCGTSVAPGANCAISVTFAPAATGSRSGALTITDNNGGTANSEQTVGLTGTGTAPAAKLSPASLSFANQNVGTSSTAQDVILTNTGTAALTLTGFSTSGDFSQSDACGTSLAAGASCTVTVTFKPVASGSRTGTLTVTDSASPGTQTVSLSGTGVGPEVTLSPASVTFGGQFVGATGAAQVITLKNTGNAALNITTIAASGDFSESQTCGSSVTAGSSCTISVTFKPTASGTRSGTLSISDSASGAPQAVALAGTGQDFSFAAAPGSSTSATVSPGQSATYTLSLTALAGLDQPISLHCSGVPPGGTCTVSPGSLTPSGSGATSVKVTVATTAALGSGTRSRPPFDGRRYQWFFVGALALGGLSLLTRRRPPPIAARLSPGLAFIGLAMVLAACGGGGGMIGTSNSTTPAGTYTLTITGTATSGSATVNHNVTLTLVVQ